MVGACTLTIPSNVLSIKLIVINASVSTLRFSIFIAEPFKGFEQLIANSSIKYLFLIYGSFDVMLQLDGKITSALLPIFFSGYIHEAS